VRGFRLAVVLAAWAAWVPPAEGFRDLQGAWLLDGAAVATVQGSDVHEGSGGWLAAGLTRLFGLAELPVSGVAASYRVGSAGRVWTVGAAWQRTGADLFREDEVELVLRFGRQPRWAVSWTHRRWTVTDYPGEVHDEPAGEVRFGPGRPWSLALRFPFSSRAPWTGSSGIRRLALAAWSVPGAGTAVAVDLDGEGRPHVGVEILVGLGNGLAAGFRAAPSSSRFGLHLAWRGPGFRFRSSHLAHPDLGTTHRFLTSAGNPAAALW
jgi:hypothetical protein